MKLYIINQNGLWGDASSHPLPATVEIFPRIEIGVAEVNGTTISIVDSKFTLDKLTDGINTVKVNGVMCELLLCSTTNGGTNGVRRIHALGQDFRAVLPYLMQIEDLKATTTRHESLLTQKDFFG
ncbi:MAG: hypothetical protein IJX39_08705 [Clostridia bacterium]|nr:hypothetical protein [Clostridia bacterium]